LSYVKFAGRYLSKNISVNVGSPIGFEPSGINFELRI
jgi:hypothetical protein